MSGATKTFILSFFSLLIIVIFSDCNKEDSPAGNLPNARFTYTSVSSVPIPATVTFVNTSTMTGGGTATYTWDFGDGTPRSNLVDPVHTYVAVGAYTVKLIQTPSVGAADSVAYTLNLGSANGPSGISYRVTGVANASFTFSIPARIYKTTFNNMTTDASSYLWTFGDGATSTTDSTLVIHTYNNAGTFYVKLSATNGNGTDTCGAMITF